MVMPTAFCLVASMFTVCSCTALPYGHAYGIMFGLFRGYRKFMPCVTVWSCLRHFAWSLQCLPYVHALRYHMVMPTALCLVFLEVTVSSCAALPYGHAYGILLGRFNVHRMFMRC